MGTLYIWVSISWLYSFDITTLHVQRTRNNPERLTRRLHTTIIRAAAHAIGSPGDGAYGQVVAGAGLSGRACAPVKVARQGDGY